MCGSQYNHGHHNCEKQCHCPRGRVERFIEPCLLLLLLKKPAHGYELMESLKRFGYDTHPDPGTIYKTLRRFEEDGLASSTWETEGSGPARRLYEVTEDGLEFLHAWAISVQGTKDRLERFLDEYEAYFNETREGR